MKVLITGSNGFVGQHLIKELDNDGHDIFGLSRTKIKKQNNFKKYFACDILQLEKLKSIIEKIKPDVIYHLAAQAYPSLSFKKPKLTLEVNLIGTLNVLEAINFVVKKENYSPRIVVVGSADSFGRVKKADLPLTETSILAPTNPYAISKSGVEFLASMYFNSYKLKIILAVPFNHTGPKQHIGFFVPDMCIQIARIEKGLQSPVIKTGDLSTQRDFTDVRDIVKGYELLLKKGKFGEKYLLCSGKVVQMQNILNQLLGLSKVKIVHKYDKTRMRPSDVPVIYGSYRKFKKATGWKPEIDLGVTLEDTLNWYRENIDS